MKGGDRRASGLAGARRIRTKSESNRRPLDVFQARSQLIAAVTRNAPRAVIGNAVKPKPAQSLTRRFTARRPSRYKAGRRVRGGPATSSSRRDRRARGYWLGLETRPGGLQPPRTMSPNQFSVTFRWPSTLARKTPAGLHLWCRNGRIGASAEPVSASPGAFSNFLAPSSRDRFARIRRSPLAVDSSAHSRQSGLSRRSYGAASEDLKLPILGSRPS